MEFANLFDLHTHSKHSFDGNDTCEELCRAAVEKKLTGIAITDHCDIDGADLDVDSLCKNLLADVTACKIKHNCKQFTVLSGLEIGQGIYRKEKTEELLSTYGFDIILGSVHNLENMQDFYFLDYNSLDVYELLDAYFDAVTELAEWGRFDSLAHLTYPLRYIKGKYKIDIDLSKFSVKIDNILKKLIENEKALEINTSEINRELADFMPNASVISRFNELGGRYITIGSDSHYANRLGNGLQEGIKLAQDCGFEYQTVFVERLPMRIKIR